MDQKTWEEKEARLQEARQLLEKEFDCSIVMITTTALKESTKLARESERELIAARISPIMRRLGFNADDRNKVLQAIYKEAP